MARTGPDSLTRNRPPFRTDQVGSLLRPAALKDARRRHALGEIDAAALRALEDAAIRDVVAKQEAAGLRAVTDGEFRREHFHLDFLRRIEGVEIRGGVAQSFQDGNRALDWSPPKPVVTGPLRRRAPIEQANFAFLKSVTRATPKLCIPSPTMTHFRGGRDAIDRTAYPEMADFFADLARLYREEIADLATAGCTYLQLDDTNLAYLCDARMREGVRALGEDPDALPRTYAALINAAIRDRPAGMSVCVHLCRGNSRSMWVAEGGYDPVAEVLFNDLAVDGYFLEYDDERSGGFAPLRFVPRGKMVVLGLVTTKAGALEDADALKRRIDEAACFVPLDQLCLSPQCGFSSNVHGNLLSEDEQFAKLRLVVDVARAVWGD